MVSILVYTREKPDSIGLIETAWDIIAKISEDFWEIKNVCSLEQMRQFLVEKPLVHMMIYDICDRDSLQFLPQLRRLYPQMRLLVLADASISPMEYIRPALRVDALLLKPWTKRQVRESLYDFLEDYLEYADREKQGNLKSYVIETREGTISVPYEQIYFFEARAKKIYVCLGKEEYGFYSSIDKLAEELPDFFARCHRGFIVNIRKIRRIVLSQNIIYLCDGFDVPLSRSYKAQLKGMGKQQ